MLTRRDLFRRLAWAVIGVSVAPAALEAEWPTGQAWRLDEEGDVGTELVSDGWSASHVLKVGDRFCLDGHWFYITSDE